jgi:SSS family solute:Na+ symporter
MHNAVLIALLTGFLMGNVFVVRRGHAPQNDLCMYSVGNRATGAIAFLTSFVGRWIPGSVCTVWFILAAERGAYAQYLSAYTIGAIIMLRICGPPLWRLGAEHKLETQADFIELRYGSAMFKGLFSLITFIVWFPWVILELKTIGQAITATSNYSIEYNLSIIAVTLFIIISCFYGGIRGVNNSSVLQTSVFVAFICVAVYLLIHAIFGGFFAMYARMAAETPEALSLDFGKPHRFELASLTLSGMLGSVFWPGIFCHIYTAKSEDVIRKSCLAAPFLALPVLILTLSLGMGARLLPGMHLSDALGLFHIAEIYGDRTLRAMLGVGVTAACMTMCAPMFNVAGVMIAKDILPFLRPSAKPDALKSAKVCTVTVGLVALWIATIEFPNLVSLVMLMYNFIIQTAAPILLGLWSKQSNLRGAAAGMAVGIFITLLFSVFPQFTEGMNGLSAGMAGFIANVTVHAAVSFATGRRRAAA